MSFMLRKVYIKISSVDVLHQNPKGMLVDQARTSRVAYVQGVGRGPGTCGGCLSRSHGCNMWMIRLTSWLDQHCLFFSTTRQDLCVWGKPCSWQCRLRIWGYEFHKGREALFGSGWLSQDQKATKSTWPCHWSDSDSTLMWIRLEGLLSCQT